jgi:lysophospholipase L1-like esterase
MSYDYPFHRITLLAALATAGAALLTGPCVAPAYAQVAQQATLSDRAKAEAAKPEFSKPQTPPAAGNVAAVGPSTPGAQKSIASKTIEKVKEVAKSATDIFSRVPCLPSKGAPNPVGSLPRVATKLAAGAPVLIIAFGSSSTNGHGASAPEFRYPDRLAAQLHRQYPSADINVLIRAKGGEDAPEMLKRLQTDVLNMKPDLVIWQVGTNAVLRNLDPADTALMVEDGVARIQAQGSDVVLVDPQYSPRVNEHPDSAGKMVKLLGRVAELRHVGIFPRFEVMRDWHERQSIPVDTFVIADGLHMNDWGYACFAQLLGDDIIKSVGQIKIGVNVPSDVRTYRPM